ncbi:MAG: hypothetical protein IIX64_00100 [Bacteroidales bacterium]|nr:hypothetical protein [Bacteroidales bacterium]
MKKTLRTFVMTVLALSAFSCAKEPVIESGEQNGYLRYFAPELVQGAYGREDVKASVDLASGVVAFEDGDQVTLTNGSVMVTYRYSAAKNLFYSEGDLPLGGTITAVYPSDLCQSISNGQMNVALSKDQMYLPGQILKAPMSGEYAGGKVRFNHLCAILELPIISDGSLSSIIFTTPQAAVCGEGVISAGSLVLNEGASKSVTLQMDGASKEQDGNYHSYFLLPAQNYPGGFNLEVKMTTGESFLYERTKDLYLSPGCIGVEQAIESSYFSGGFGTQEKPYRIARPADLLQLRDLINSESYADFADKYYQQVADLDFAGSVIRVISTEDGEEFKGVYDGGGFKIKNGVITRSHHKVGLFGATIGATLRNIHFENCNVPNGLRGVAFLVGQAQEGTVIEDCSVTGGTVNTSWTGVGSIAGELKASSIARCSSSATVKGVNGTTYSGAGGIVGYIDKGVSTVADCSFTGQVTVSRLQGNLAIPPHNVGGIVGNIFNSASVVKACNFSGSVSGCAGNMGGIVGSASASSTIADCVVSESAKIEGGKEAVDTANAIGGIVGALASASVYGEVRNCKFNGSVLGHAAYVGGIVGTSIGAIRVTDCTLQGKAKVECTGTVAGGIVANCETGSSLGSIRGCKVESGASITVTGWGVGGIIARNYGVNVSACSVKGATITTGNNNAGGISGTSRGNITYSDCQVESSTIKASELLASGIVAELLAWDNSRFVVSNCVVKGCTIQSKYYTGGIGGNFKASAIVDQCTVLDTDVTSTNGGEAGGILGKTSTGGILVANSMYCGGSVVGSTSTSGIGGIVGSFYSEHGLTSGKSLSTTSIVNCMSNPKLVKNTNSTSANALVGGIAGHMAYTRINNAYSTVSAETAVHAGTDAEGKWGTLYGYMIYGGEVINGYWIEGFKAGYTNSSYTYTQKIQKARDTQMRQNDATSNVFWVPSEYPDGDYRQSNMVAALNKGVAVYNAASPMYGIQARTWVKTSAYDYPVIAGSVLDNGSTTVQKKRVAILGDSISTFQDWSNNVSNYQYPKNSVYEAFKVTDTYWYQLIYNKMSNAELDVNSSYCGSTVQDNAAKGKPSFISRYADLRNPDIILINGGTNDSWSYRLPVGTLNFDLSLEELDTYQFAQAYDKLIRLLQREYPSAKIFLIIGDCLRDFPTYTKVITDLAAHYNLKTAQITFADRTTMTYQRTGTSDVNVHPNIAGMKEMANQIWNQLKNDL